MNILLLEPQEIDNSRKIRLEGRRAKHVIDVLNAKPGDRIRAGVIDGQVGNLIVKSISGQELDLLWVASDNEVPAPINCIVVLALPRPKMMRRVLQTLASLGVKEVHLINSWKVEKSYWQSPCLTPEAIHRELIFGLEQCIDTRLPAVHLHKLFKPFVEDLLPTLVKNRHSMVAHPLGSNPCPVDVNVPSLLAIGPEGGFTDYEVNLMESSGLTSVNIGPRILRVETAIPTILGRLYPG